MHWIHNTIDYFNLANKQNIEQFSQFFSFNFETSFTACKFFPLRYANKFTIFGEIFHCLEKKNDFQTQNSLVYSCLQNVQLQH